MKGFLTGRSADGAGMIGKIPGTTTWLYWNDYVFAWKDISFCWNDLQKAWK